MQFYEEGRKFCVHGNCEKFCVKVLPIKRSVCKQTLYGISAYQPVARIETTVCTPKRECRGRYPGILIGAGILYVKQTRGLKT